MRQSRIVQQALKRGKADTSLPDMLMTVELRAALSFGVIAMPDVNILQADSAVELVDRIGISLFANDVVTGDVGVACVYASSNRNVLRQEIVQFGDLFEVAPERELRPGRVLDQDAEVSG